MNTADAVKGYLKKDYYERSQAPKSAPQPLLPFITISREVGAPVDNGWAASC